MMNGIRKNTQTVILENPTWRLKIAMERHISKVTMKLPIITKNAINQAQLLLFQRKIKSRIALAKLSLSALSLTTPPNTSFPRMIVTVSAKISASDTTTTAPMATTTTTMAPTTLPTVP